MLLKIIILISMFLTGFNVYSVFAYACFMCICLKTAIWLFLTFLAQGLFFLVKIVWEPWSLVKSRLRHRLELLFNLCGNINSVKTNFLLFSHPDEANSIF